MPRILFQGITIFLFGAFIAGCTATNGLSLRAYTEDNPRVDTKVEGNAGYIMGTPPAEALKPIDKTRRFYVVELSKEAEDVEAEEMVVSQTTTTNYRSSYDDDSYDQRTTRKTSYQTTTPASKIMAKAPTFSKYTVEKGDTLQKISKKFYDSYSKWTKIYEVNKDVIPNPNSIKPGIVLRIPQE
jgi:nucleoid-associated protein YgaU